MEGNVVFQAVFCFFRSYRFPCQSLLLGNNVFNDNVNAAQNSGEVNSPVQAIPYMNFVILNWGCAASSCCLEILKPTENTAIGALKKL